MNNFETIAAGLNILSKTLFLECGSSENIEDIIAVGWVVKNRVRKQNKTYKQICLQSKQFSCWNKTKPEDVNITNVFRWRICVAIADYIINAKERWNPLPKVYHYINPDLCSPSWAKKMKKVNYNCHFSHIFLREET